MASAPAAGGDSPTFADEVEHTNGTYLPHLDGASPPSSAYRVGLWSRRPRVRGLVFRWRTISSRRLRTEGKAVSRFPPSAFRRTNGSGADPRRERHRQGTRR